MTEPTKKKAEMLLILVGSAAAALVIAAVAIWVVSKLFGLEAVATVEWLIGVVAAVFGGALGFKVFTDKKAD